MANSIAYDLNACLIFIPQLGFILMKSSDLPSVVKKDGKLALSIIAKTVGGMCTGPRSLYLAICAQVGTLLQGLLKSDIPIIVSRHRVG